MTGIGVECGGRIDGACTLFANECIGSGCSQITFKATTLISSISREKGVMSTKIGRMRGDSACNISQYATWEPASKCT
jgi:hypothetical protein